MRINKWLVLACALSMLFMFSMSCVMLVQSAGISSSVVPNVITKTTQFGVPAAFLEWDAHQLIKAGGIYSFTGKSPISFTGLSVGWSVNDPTADPRSFVVSIRTRKGDIPWTEWVHFPGNIGPGESPSGLFWSHLYTPSDFSVHVYFEIRIQPPAGMPLTFVRVTVTDNSAVPETTNPRESLRGLGDITSLGVPAEPVIIPRVDWLGAEHPWNVSQITISHTIVHHTNHPNIPRNLNQSKQLMRDIRLNDHMLSQGKDDIGYNFVIDREGRIFQGRHNPWHSTTDVGGAHAFFANRYSVGIALMGQFQPGEPIPVGHPSAASLRSLERLLAWRFHQRTLNPLGQANINTFWGIRNIHRIAGHRDVGARGGWTACPGDNLQVLLPTIRTNVRNLIPPRLHVSPASVVGSLAPGVGWTTVGTVNVTNPGGGTLNWSATSNRAWLSVTPSSGTTTTETDSVSVRATAAGLLPGTYTGTITFTGASPATGTPATVNVTLTVTTAAPVVFPVTAGDT